MDLPNPKELKALLKVCREYGVSDVEVGALKVKFGELPKEASAEEADQTQVGPSDEDLAFWSAAPDPLEQRMASQ